MWRKGNSLILLVGMQTDTTIMENIMETPKKKNLGIKQYDPAIPQLDMYPEETRIERDTCTPVFIAALFTIVRTWKQPRKQPQQMNG